MAYSRVLVVICALWAGCGSATSAPDHIDGPDFMQTPIWLSDTTGTYSFTVAAPQPVRLNDRAGARMIPSPGRTRIALTLWSGGAGTEVYDLAGTLLGSFEGSLELVGWAGEDSLVFIDQNIAAGMERTNLDGTVRTQFDFGFTADTGFPSIFAAATSREGKYLAVSFLLDAEALVLDTASGEIVQSYAIDEALYPPALAWLYDNTLVLGSAFGGSALFTTRPTSSALARTAFPGSPCSVDSWTPAYPMLLGEFELYGDVDICTRRMAARANGTGLVPLDWLTDPGQPGSSSPSAVYALSPDARRVVYLSNGAINIASPTGSGSTPLLTLQSAPATLAW